MRRKNERNPSRGRLAVEGRRTDDAQVCTLVMVQELGGLWALYPHGAGRRGVRLAQVVRMAKAILAGVR
ncbi:MAG: hypothetical protein ACRDSR_15320 [Pseudonocardiaceae bacterium]